MTTTNGHRPRFTRATVRTIDNDTLVEVYQRSHIWKALVDGNYIVPTPIEKAKGKKQHAILRAELLKRGFVSEMVDYELPKELFETFVDEPETKLITDGN